MTIDISMEQTENEFGIPYKDPEKKKELEQAATGQPAGDEQSKTDDEETSEETKAILDECEKRQRRQDMLEKAMICVMVIVGLSMAGWMLCGRWINAVNNLLWLFVAWMFWRQQRLFHVAAKVVHHFVCVNINLRKQIKQYEKMVKVYGEKDELWHKLQQNYERQIANSEKKITKLNELAQKQDNLIKIYTKQ